MTDRESVINEIEKKIKNAEEGFGISVFRPDTLKIIVALLKEQEAIEPVEEFIKGINRYDYHCKRCGNIVGTIFDDKHPIFPGAKLSIKHFCDVCGQAVKWNE